MRKRYTAEQRERLVAEVAAGEAVPVVAARMGVGASAAYLWVKGAREESKPRFAKLVRTSAPASSSMVVEVGRARLRIEAGFDAELLRLVVWALSDAS